MLSFSCGALGAPTMARLHSSSFWGGRQCVDRRTVYLHPFKRHRSTLRMCTEVDNGERDVQTLLESSDYIDRIRGVNRSGEIGDVHDRIQALLPIAGGDPNGQVRFCSLSHLASLKRDAISDEDAASVLEVVREVLSSDVESSCRSGAADVIAGLRLRDGFDDLVACFRASGDWMLKFSIAAGMGELGDPRAFDFLSSILDDEASDELLITATVGALGDLGDMRALPLIERYMQSDEPSVKERARIAHSMLTNSSE